jgi:hypothetical protein
LEGKVAAPVKKSENANVGIRHADLMAPSIRKKLALTWPTTCCRSVSIVRLQAQATGVIFSIGIQFACFLLCVFSLL